MTVTFDSKPQDADPSLGKMTKLSINGDEKEGDVSYAIEQIETGEKTSVALAERALKGCPRHTVGCTPYECHGALMEKKGFGQVKDGDAPGAETTLDDAVAFLTQYAKENKGAYDNLDGGLKTRLAQMEEQVKNTGTYVHSFDELQYGCRLAWRNSGRCIMRKVSFTLELRDCRTIQTAEEMFDQILDHLEYAANGGAIKPVISVFAPKTDGQSAPVRIWNPQLVGYAAYQRPDGSIMGDPARLKITALAVKFGWEPPDDDDKSDFDILPLVISDEATGHDKPKVFPLSPEQALEVPIEHPEHEAFGDLNLRWYALPAISNIGVDIGGVMYQSCPFNGWYAVTEIGRDFLDKQRYDLAHAVSIACDIPRTTLAVWKDDVQLQVHRAILHSFAKHSVSIVDHHTASNSFQEFFQDEISQRGKCPADWVWLVPPAGGSMTSVFHQEMFHFIQKPQYRLLADIWDEVGVDVPDPVQVDASDFRQSAGSSIDKDKCIYSNIIVCFGSETGTSLKYANIVAGMLQDNCVGPVAMDSVPALLSLYSGFDDKPKLLIVVTSTFGKGCPPNGAGNFIPELSKIGTVKNFDFTVLALGNSAYVNSFVNFAVEATDALKKCGCRQALPIKIADELKNQDEAFGEWEDKLYGDSSSILYVKSASTEVTFDAVSSDDQGGKKMKLTFSGSAPLTKDANTIGREMKEFLAENYMNPWAADSIGTALRTTDLFSFKARGEKTHEYLYSGDVQAGDHIALFPQNQIDSVETILGLTIIEDNSKIDEYRKTLTKDVDLCRPLLLSSIKALREICKEGRGKLVLDLIIANSTGCSDDPNSTSNSNPSAEMIINQLPPRTIPIEWMLKHTPQMTPRFYSISSINGDEVTITQSVFRFAHNSKVGTTSKWLRLSLNPGDKIEAVFATNDFHLPDDESAPVIMIATGSGIAPFRSFWMAKKLNPMHLFFGCQKESDVPFKTELEQLQKSGRLVLHPAYSRGEKPQYVQDRLMEDADTIRKLLTKHPGTTIFVCGTPDMEFSIREKLVRVVGGGIVNATMAVARMKVQGKYIAEVYGKPAKNADSPMGSLWEECLSKTIHISASLDRIGIPKPRKEARKVIRRTRTSVMSGNPGRMRLTVRPVMTKGKSNWMISMMPGLDDEDSDSDSD